MFVFKSYKVMVIVLLCGSLFACSKVPDYAPPAFYPERVACRDVSSLQQRTELDALLRNPGGDVYTVNHINRILPMLHKLADAGNIHGVLVYGDMEYEYQYLLHQDDVRQEKKFVFPDSTKAKLIDALTYVLLAALNEPSDKHSKQLLNEIKARIPQEWSDEAEDNVKRWNAYCRNR